MLERGNSVFVINIHGAPVRLWLKISSSLYRDRVVLGDQIFHDLRIELNIFYRLIIDPVIRNISPSIIAGNRRIKGEVSPVMEKLSEAYKELNKDVEVEIQTSDSTTGVSNAIEGISDIGMASRDLKDSELETLKNTVIAKDGIAIVVNNASPIENLTSDQIMKIYTGEITTWADVK